VIRVNPAESKRKNIEEMIKKYVGASIRFNLGDVKIYELHRPENIEARRVELEKSGYRID
jgi:hypothetical protein